MERITHQIHDGRMFLYVLFSIVMSGYDAMATMQHIGRGIAAEGNPLMAPLVQENAIAFFMVKMGITVLCLALCYRFSRFAVARLGIQLVAAAYSLLCLYHVAITIFI